SLSLMPSSQTVSEPSVRRRRRLWVEFIGLFFAAPVVLGLFLPPSAMLPELLIVTIAGVNLLHRTPGFRWRDLTYGWREIDWRIVAVFSIVTTCVSLAIVALVVPDAFLILYRFNPVAWLAVILLYPFLSALPQEVLF